MLVEGAPVNFFIIGGCDEAVWEQAKGSISSTPIQPMYDSLAETSTTFSLLPVILFSIWICFLVGQEADEYSKNYDAIWLFLTLLKNDMWLMNMPMILTCILSWWRHQMENISRVTGPLWGEFIGHRWIPLTNASDTELWCLLWSAPEQTIEQTIETLVIWDAIVLIMASM